MVEEWREELAKSPDLRHTIEDIIAEGDKVAYRWTMRWTNQETGKQEAYRGITFMRIADGKIVEDWYSAGAIEE
jgi:predicted ester cyclase